MQITLADRKEPSSYQLFGWSGGGSIALGGSGGGSFGSGLDGSSTSSIASLNSRVTSLAAARSSRMILAAARNTAGISSGPIRISATARISSISNKSNVVLKRSSGRRP
jgi:hypothetical protein